MNHYVYVDTGYECTSDRFGRNNDNKKKFIEKCIQYVDSGKIVHIDNKIRKDEKEAIEQIVNYFGDYHDRMNCRTYDETTNCCTCKTVIHCDNPNCENHKHLSFYNGRLVGDSYKFPGRMDKNYDSSNPLLKFSGSETVDLANIIKICDDLSWCHIWIDEDQIKDAKLKTFEINDRIKFSCLWLDAESG